VAHLISIEIDGRNCIGLDVGDRWSWFHVEDARGKEIRRGKVKTVACDIVELFGRMKPARIALEVGTHSPWVSELLERMGHEVTVANAQRVALISRNRRKGDKVDAQLLCLLQRAEPKLLFPIRHRGAQARADLALVRARDALVRSRTVLINHLRGSVKSFGTRIPSKITPDSFHKQAGEHLPRELREALSPTLQILARITSQIRNMDKQILRMSRERYPETEYLLQVKGVGPITALTYVLTIEDPTRFLDRRDVGAYLGLVPRRCSSGNADPELSITKSGDGALRRLLVQCANYILGRFGEDSDLRRWGVNLASRGKKNAKKRATIAVARKLSVMLLSLWVNRSEYVPLAKSEVAA
jgi:transposase